MNAATRAYIAELLAERPPLGPEQRGLVVRVLANRPEDGTQPTRKTRTKRPAAA